MSNLYLLLDWNSADYYPGKEQCNVCSFYHWAVCLLTVVLLLSIVVLHQSSILSLDHPIIFSTWCEQAATVIFLAVFCSAYDELCMVPPLFPRIYFYDWSAVFNGSVTWTAETTEIDLCTE
jgi:hypothetical protein